MFEKIRLSVSKTFKNENFVAGLSTDAKLYYKRINQIALCILIFGPMIRLDCLNTVIVLHNFFALDEEARAAVNSAASLICNGIEWGTKMKSISYISFVSSIETMMNLEFKNVPVGNSETCG